MRGAVLAVRWNAGASSPPRANTPRERVRLTRGSGTSAARRDINSSGNFFLENQQKRSLRSDIGWLKLLMPWIGNVEIDKIHTGTLQPWIDNRRKEGAAIGTINHGLKIVHRILQLAANEWVDEFGLTWLPTAPRIKLLADTNKRKPYPLNWDEQARLFDALPDHLSQMALLAVNTCCRDSEICNLRWPWEVNIPQL